MKQSVLLFSFCNLLLSCLSPKEKIKASFDKITFHTSLCYGYCPVFHLEISHTKYLKLQVVKVFKEGEKLVDTNYTEKEWVEDTSAPGFFTGELSDSIFNKLNNEIKNLGLDSLNVTPRFGDDGPCIGISVYYNGKTKQMLSEKYPAKVKNLVYLLYAICETKSLTRAKGSLSIED